MIIKTISHRSTYQFRMQALVDYVFDKDKMTDLNRESVVVKQFLRGYDPNTYGRQFKQNDEKRTFENKRRSVLRHEIVSFHEDDDLHLTRDNLKRIAKKYIDKRAPDSLCLAVAHYNENPHIHFIISSVTRVGASTRLSRGAFQEFKKEMEKWQEKEFPQLTASVVDHSKPKEPRLKLSQKEQHMKLKRGVMSEKEILSIRIKELIKNCKTLSDVKQILEQERIETYARKPQDVVSGVYLGKRKLRLTTLGVSKSRYKKLSLEEKRMQELQNLRKQKNRNHNLNR